MREELAMAWCLKPKQKFPWIGQGGFWLDLAHHHHCAPPSVATAHPADRCM